MKLIILIGLTAIFVAKADALECLLCDGETPADCLAANKTETCIGEQNSCATEYRPPTNLIFQSCKQGLACENNNASNPEDCSRSGQVCRCCCYDDLCNRNSPCGPPAGTTTVGPPVSIDPEQTTVAEPKEVDCFCDEIDAGDFNGEIFCSPSLPNGYWTDGGFCDYHCPIGQRFVDGSSFVFTRVCRPAVLYPEFNNAGKTYIWYPESPGPCLDDPNYCHAEPIWNAENSPNGVVGNIVCDSVSSLAEESESKFYEIGHRCTYSCPAGYELVGVDTATCTHHSEITGSAISLFSPGNPCCRELCQTDRNADLLFVLDWSSSIRQHEWILVTTFVADVITQLRDNQNLLFGVEVFGKGVKTNHSIKFTKFSNRLLEDIKNIPFNGEEEGTYTVAALQYATKVVFGSEKFNQREGNDNLVVFITDGVSTDKNPTESVKQAAAKLHNETLRVYSIGIGFNHIKQENNRKRAGVELMQIAETAENHFNVTNFAGLYGALDQITTITCDDPCEGFKQKPF